jgi:hypothetical protein
LVGNSEIFHLVTRDEHPNEGAVSVDRGVTVGHFGQDVGETKGAPRSTPSRP